MRIAAIATALAALVAGSAHAAPAVPAGDPRPIVEAMSAKVLAAALEETDQDKMIARIKGVLDGALDYDGFSQRTLKGTWEGLKPAERTRFQTQFTELVSHTYARRFKPGTKFDVSFRGDTEWIGEGKQVANVRTTITGEKAAADVDYRFEPARVGGELVWRITDITIDGVAMALNWRTQFKRIIDRDGFDALLAKIEAKVRKTRGGNGDDSDDARAPD